MVLDDRLAKDSREKEKKRNLPPDEEEEEYYTYTERKKEPFLNGEQSVFSVEDKSINTAKSVFDRDTVFRTGKNADEAKAHRVTSGKELEKLLGRSMNVRI